MSSNCLNPHSSAPSPFQFRLKTLFFVSWMLRFSDRQPSGGSPCSGSQCVGAAGDHASFDDIITHAYYDVRRTNGQEAVSLRCALCWWHSSLEADRHTSGWRRHSALCVGSGRQPTYRAVTCMVAMFCSSAAVAFPLHVNLLRFNNSGWSPRPTGRRRREGRPRSASASRTRAGPRAQAFPALPTAEKPRWSMWRYTTRNSPAAHSCSCRSLRLLPLLLRLLCRHRHSPTPPPQPALAKMAEAAGVTFSLRRPQP